MKYKVGDKVKVRSDLRVGNMYYMEDRIAHDSFVSEMRPFLGKVVTISKNDHEYKIINDNNEWNWTDEMFEGLAKDCEANPMYQEIIVLHRLLQKYKIPHTFEPMFNGYHICYPKNGGCVCSVIEHDGSYGHEDDLLEISGLFTDEEHKSVVGFLTADEVFDRIRRHYETPKKKKRKM